METSRILSNQFAGFWLDWRYTDPVILVLPLVGGFIPVLLQLLYNKLCFGNFLSMGYANLIDLQFRSDMAQGGMGIQWPDLRVLYIW
jgi:hypothetical protein